jgi:hypothetical protein
MFSFSSLRFLVRLDLDAHTREPFHNDFVIAQALEFAETSGDKNSKEKEHGDEVLTEERI